MLLRTNFGRQTDLRRHTEQSYLPFHITHYYSVHNAKNTRTKLHNDQVCVDLVILDMTLSEPLLFVLYD